MLEINYDYAYFIFRLLTLLVEAVRLKPKPTTSKIEFYCFRENNFDNKIIIWLLHEF